MQPLKLVARGGIFSLCGDAFNYALSYVFLIVATHWLGPALLGSYYWAIAMAGLLAEFAECGLGQGLIYFGPRFETTQGPNQSLPLFTFVLRLTLTNACLLGLIFFFSAPYLATFFGKPHLTWLLQLAALSLPLSTFWPVLYKYCVARFKIAEGILYGDILRPALRVALLLVLIFLGLKPIALINTEILVGALLILGGLYLIYKNWGDVFNLPKLARTEKRTLLTYSLPFLPLNLSRGERWIIILASWFLAVSQIGIFGVVLKIAAVSQVILTGLNFIFRPMVAKLYIEKDLATLVSIFQAITRWIFLLTLPLSYLFIFYPAAILGLFEERFTCGALALTIVAIGYLFEYGTSATQVIINMTGKSWLSLFNQMAYFLIILILGCTLIPSGGILGAALSVAAAIVMINLLRLWQTYQIIKALPYSPYLIKPLCATLVAGLSMHFIFPLGQALTVINTLCLALGFLAIYAATVWGLGLHTEDKNLLTHILRLLPVKVWRPAKPAKYQTPPPPKPKK